MICQRCTILTSTQLEHKFCAAAIGERPYSALASSDAEIGAGRAYAVPAGGYFAQNHYTGTHREYLQNSGRFAQTFCASTHRVLYAGPHYARTHMEYLQRLLTLYSQMGKSSQVGKSSHQYILNT